MVEFDHAELARKLAKIPGRIRPLFAAMIAERLFPHAIAFFGKHDTEALNQLRSALEQVWRCSSDQPVNHAERETALATCMVAIQSASNVATGSGTYPLTGVQRKVAEESGIRALKVRDISVHDPNADAAFFAENAAAAVAYGLRSMAAEDPNEAAWAAQTAYDTVDRFVMLQERDLDVEWTEAQIRDHPVIQQELQRQLNDIKTLETLSSAAEQDKAKLTKLREVARYEAQSIFLHQHE